MNTIKNLFVKKKTPLKSNTCMHKCFTPVNFLSLPLKILMCVLLEKMPVAYDVAIWVCVSDSMNTSIFLHIQVIQAMMKYS